MIFVNFKTYQRGTGEEGLFLVKMLEEVAHFKQVKIIPVVQASDLQEFVVQSKLEIWVQHIDAVEYGAHTGFVLAEAVKEDGAIGTFLNHSEKKFESKKELEMAVKRAKKNGLKTLIFGDNLKELKTIIKYSPDYVSYEPPELVGSSTMSVASAHPETIEKAAKMARKNGLPLVVGAGIHTRSDVKKSLELGAVGVAVASDIVKASDPKKELLDLIAGFE